MCVSCPLCSTLDLVLLWGTKGLGLCSGEWITKASIIRPSICCHFFWQYWLKHLLVYLASARNWFAVTKQAPEPVQVSRWWHISAARAGKGRIHGCSVSWHCCLSSGYAGGRKDKWCWIHRRCCVTQLLCKRCWFGNQRTHCAYHIIQ